LNEDWDETLVGLLAGFFLGGKFDCNATETSRVCIFFRFIGEFRGDISLSRLRFGETVGVGFLVKVLGIFTAGSFRNPTIPAPASSSLRRSRRRRHWLLIVRPDLLRSLFGETVGVGLLARVLCIFMAASFRNLLDVRSLEPLRVR